MKFIIPRKEVHVIITQFVNWVSLLYQNQLAKRDTAMVLMIGWIWIIVFYGTFYAFHNLFWVRDNGHHKICKLGHHVQWGMHFMHPMSYGHKGVKWDMSTNWCPSMHDGAQKGQPPMRVVCQVTEMLRAHDGWAGTKTETSRTLITNKPGVACVSLQSVVRKLTLYESMGTTFIRCYVNYSPIETTNAVMF